MADSETTIYSPFHLYLLVVKAYSSSMNTSFDGVYQYPASLVVDQRISRMMYLKSESSYFRSLVSDQFPWLALDLGNPWIINSVSVVRFSDSLASITNFFQVMKNRGLAISSNRLARQKNIVRISSDCV